MPKLRKIHIDQAMVGMFVASLDCDWTAHPFWLSRFCLRNAAQIDMLRQEGIQSFYIDTEKGRDIPHAASAPAPAGRTTTKKSQARTTPLSQELGLARDIVQRTEAITQNLMKDARLGQRLDVTALHRISSELSGSLDRNAQALRMVAQMYNKDAYTFQHSVSVALLLMILQHHQGAPHEIVVEAGIGGLLHDIGKTRIPLQLLNKPGRHTAEERQQMREHVRFSQMILDENGIHSPIIRAIALQHHERYDGTGYPLGLAGDAISVYGQQAAIIDVYDAITSDRCYHKGLPAPVAIKKIFELGKNHFDPKVVRDVVHCFGIYPPGTLVRLASGKLAVVKRHADGDLTRPEVVVFFDTQRNQRLKPESINLAIRYGPHADDHVVHHEAADRWQALLPDINQLLLDSH